MYGYAGNPWKHWGGGCNLVGTDDDPHAKTHPCDDEYRSADGQTVARYRSTPEGHFATPPYLDRPDELAKRKGFVYLGLSPAENPRRNPLQTWHKVLLGTLIVGGALGVGIFLFARPARAASLPVPDEGNAIDDAIAQLGKEAPTSSIAQVAYAMAYPEGPHPPVGDYLLVWHRIVTTIQERLARGDGEVPAPTTPADVDDTSERAATWLTSLTDAQRAEVRDTIGAALFDPLVRSAQSKDDLSSRAALGNIKSAIEQVAAESKFSAFAMYSRLNSALGDELLGEFKQILEDTAGPLVLA